MANARLLLFHITQVGRPIMLEYCIISLGQPVAAGNKDTKQYTETGHELWP